MTLTHPFIPDDPGVLEREDSLARLGWLIFTVGAAVGSMALAVVLRMAGVF